MKIILIFSLVVVMAAACSQEQAPESDSDTNATSSLSKADKTKPKSKTREPKWVVAIDGLPELSGRTMTAIGSIKGGKFALAKRGFTASISLSPEGEIPFMNMTFNKQNIRCLNYGSVVPNIDGTRVELSGEVGCSPIDGDTTEKRKAKINGWFETKK